MRARDRFEFRAAIALNSVQIPAKANSGRPSSAQTVRSRSISHLGFRKDQLQQIKTRDASSHQIYARRRGYRRGGGERGHREGLQVDTDTYVEVTKKNSENVALESTRTIEIDQFVQRTKSIPATSYAPIIFVRMER